MIVKLVSYQLPGDMSREDVVTAARQVAEEWLQYPGLLRKDFLLDDNNMTYGYYLFRDRESAEQAHDKKFFNRIKDRFNTEPEIKYFDYLMTADVQEGRIRTAGT